MLPIGAGDFHAVGEKFKRYFIELGGLTPASNVLEVGCSYGRMAVPLVDFLTEGRLVFTHRFPPEVRNYTREIARVLTGEGRMMATYFLLNREAASLIAGGRSQVDLAHRLGRGPDEYYVVDPHAPGYGVGYGEPQVRDMLMQSGLCIVEPIHYGAWCGREEFVGYQDIVVAAPS